MIEAQVVKVRAHVFIRGRVQGVFFRSEVRREAIRHGVTGWVRNLSDGRVEAVFEGEESDVKNTIEFCRKGPPYAKIAGIGVDLQDYIGEFESFEVRVS